MVSATAVVVLILATAAASHRFTFHIETTMKFTDDTGQEWKLFLGPRLAGQLKDVDLDLTSEECLTSLIESPIDQFNLVFIICKTQRPDLVDAEFEAATEKCWATMIDALLDCVASYLDRMGHKATGASFRQAIVAKSKLEEIAVERINTSGQDFVNRVLAEADARLNEVFSADLS